MLVFGPVSSGPEDRVDVWRPPCIIDFQVAFHRGDADRIQLHRLPDTVLIPRPYSSQQQVFHTTLCRFYLGSLNHFTVLCTTDGNVALRYIHFELTDFFLESSTTVSHDALETFQY